MMSDLVTALELNSITGKCFMLTKDDTSDLNFVFSEILTYYIRNNYAVIVINFGQTPNHYKHLLTKSGIRSQRDQNLIIIDGLNEFAKLADSMNGSIHNSIFKDVLLNCRGTDCLKELYMSVSKSVDLLKQADKKFIVFLDEMNILLNVGLTMRAIESFIQYCLTLCIGHVPSPNFLLMGSAYDELDAENNKLVKFLLHMADVKVQVEGLKTGYSKDAHGKITISKVTENTGTSSYQKLLFKISEKGPKLLTLGV